MFQNFIISSTKHYSFFFNIISLNKYNLKLLQNNKIANKKKKFIILFFFSEILYK